LKDTGSRDGRLASYRKAWEQLQKEQTPTLKKALERAEEDITSRKKEKQTKQKQLDEEKDAAKKEELKKDLEAIDGSLGSAEAQVGNLKAQLERLSPEKQEKAWEQGEAYATDAWRLVYNRKLCLQCHQIGEERASNPLTQGPPLALAHQRLRPDWTYRWIAAPMHFAPIAGTPMPQYFKSNASGADYKHLFVGSGPAEVRAARDVLMNYPRVSALPVNRLYRPEMGDEKK
jgi:hypothetical protein